MATYTNEQLATLILERTGSLAKQLDEVNAELKVVNGTVRGHAVDINTLQVKVAKGEKKWDLLWLAVVSPIISSLITAFVTYLLVK